MPVFQFLSNVFAAMADTEQPVQQTPLSPYAKAWIEGRTLAPPTLPEQYATLRSTGLTPLAAIVAMCRSRPDLLSAIIDWFARKNPEAGPFADRWLKNRRAESREYAILTGAVQEGCYHYFSISNRPTHTVFIRWDEIASIYVQDGRDMLALAIYSPGPYGGKHMQAQSNIPGFASFVEEVSSRFFGKRDYLSAAFKRGDHEVRKFQVWPKNELAELEGKDSVLISPARPL